MIRRLILAVAFAASLLAPAAAQQGGFPPITMPPNTIFGNPMPVPAFGQAIPNGQLFLALFPTGTVTCPLNQWMTGFTSSGPACAQPSYSQITGVLNINGATSGAISILAQAVTGSFNFNLPISAGTAGTCLASGGGGSNAMTWTTCATGSGVPQNNLNTQTSNYTIATSDCGKTIQAGTGSSGLFTVTLPAVTGFASNCVLDVYNGDSLRGKTLSGFPVPLASTPNNILWAGDTIQVGIINGAWAVLAGASRHRIVASTTLFVDNTNGSDTNDCLAATTNACKTIQGAISYLQTWDGNAQAVTISVADATYTAGAIFSGPLHGNPTVTLQGNLVTPANVVISTTSADAIKAANGASISVGGFKLATTTSGQGIFATNGSFVTVNGAMEFGAVANGHLAPNFGSVITVTANYTISGNAQFHYRANFSGTISVPSITVTTSGTPAFSSAFASVSNGGQLSAFNQTYSGTGATGTRYAVATGGVIFTNQTSATYFPGNAAGTVASGGRMDGVGTPSVSSCGGGSPAVTAGSTDFSGSLTEGTTATACTITFSTGSTMKACNVSLSTGNAVGITTLGSTLVVAHSSLSSNVLYWTCAN